MSFAEAILFIVVPQAEAWGFLGLTLKDIAVPVISRIRCRAGQTEQSSEWEKGRLSEAFCRPGESGAEEQKQEWL